MPLSSPSGSGGGIARQNMILRASFLSDGADLGIDYNSANWDSVANRALIGGNNSFCGIIEQANLFTSKINQFPALPSTVILNGPVQDIEQNVNDGGIIVRVNNEFARSADDGATWVDITPGFAVAYDGVASWKTDQIICSHQRVAAGDYTVSADNGATFPNQFHTGMTAANPARGQIVKSPGQEIMAMLGTAAQLAITTSDDLTVAAWTVFNFQTLFPGVAGNPGDMAFNTTGDKIVYGTLQGDVVVSINGGGSFTQFPEATNLFKNGTTNVSFRPVNVVEYISSLDIFILLSTDRAAVIDGSGNLLTMDISSYAMATVPVVADGAGLSDGINMFAFGNLNQALMLAKGS